MCPMNSKMTLIIFPSLILMVGYLTPLQAVTDAEIEALEKQIEQLESEEKRQAEAAENKKAEGKRKAEQKRKAEAEMEKKRLAEQKRIEEARLAELERQRQEEEAKKRAEEEKKKKYNLLIAEAKQAINDKDKELAISKYNEALTITPGDPVANSGIKEAENLLEKGCYKIVGAWRGSGGNWLVTYDTTINFNIDGTFKENGELSSGEGLSFKGIWKCLNPDKGEYTKQYSGDNPTDFPMKMEGDKLSMVEDISKPRKKIIYQRVK